MNLTLIPVLKIHKLKLSEGKDRLADYLGLNIPTSWPTFPEAFLVTDQDSKKDEPEKPNLWGGYFFINPILKSLIGNGGYTGAPDSAGSVEIGYEIAPEFWNQGYATLAAKQLIELAFKQPNVLQVKATTLAEENASNSVLKKCGMKFVSEEPNEELGKVWVFGIDRKDFENPKR
ncbi:GNAT family N-acetyltransferase [Leptospira sp. FAT2]|uniref:GNAT family N-acetyltransferase n=1 Tax=Leptospira sanjuanensis TaxID=2879643 RepID=UPI001EE7EA53|nr:GNAT family N-acetyltransferase [Leptospira sanjuanensis]MCG6168334.1 GNAT family N-acetyltransferase [Leptospira sanjuanensis]MCG6193752.1 GNAT family N-acetyltransferase [Leptospira sanjuanensis]